MSYSSSPSDMTSADATTFCVSSTNPLHNVHIHWWHSYVSEGRSDGRRGRSASGSYHY